MSSLIYQLHNTSILLIGPFVAKALDEKYFSNANETHFIVNMDNDHTFGFKGDMEVEYSDVVSEGKGMKILVRISGGIDARIETPFMVSCNKNLTYPSRVSRILFLGFLIARARKDGCKSWYCYNGLEIIYF